MTYPDTPPTEPPRPPAWRPPHSDPGRGASLVGGVIMVVIGAWIVLGSLRRRR